MGKKAFLSLVKNLFYYISRSLHKPLEFRNLSGIIVLFIHIYYIISRYQFYFMTTYNVNVLHGYAKLGNRIDLCVFRIPRTVKQIRCIKNDALIKTLRWVVSLQWLLFSLLQKLSSLRSMILANWIISSDLRNSLFYIRTYLVYTSSMFNITSISTPLIR